MLLFFWFCSLFIVVRRIFFFFCKMISLFEVEKFLYLMLSIDWIFVSVVSLLFKSFCLFNLFLIIFNCFLKFWLFNFNLFSLVVLLFFFLVKLLFFFLLNFLWLFMFLLVFKKFMFCFDFFLLIVFCFLFILVSFDLSCFFVWFFFW